MSIEHLKRVGGFVYICHLLLAVIRRDARICRMLGIGCLIEGYIGMVFQSCPNTGRERGGSEGSGEPVERRSQ